jgi:hypothetical protein
MRLAVALLLLVVFIVMAVRLTPPLFENRQFRAYLDQVAASPESATLPLEMLRIRIVGKARQMGLPVRAGDVRVTRGPAGPSIDIRYVVSVDFYVSSIDLHLHARGGARRSR